MCDGKVERQPWPTAIYFEIEESTNDFLAQAGVLPRPPGRIWLLRPPDGWASPDEFLDDVGERWVAAGNLDTLSPGLVHFTRHRIDQVF